MPAQCTLISHLERPVLPNLLLDVQEKLLSVAGLMVDRVRIRGRGTKLGHCTGATWRRVGPGQTGVTKIAGAVRIRRRHAPGNITSHVEIRVADVLRIEDSIAGANHRLG